MFHIIIITIADEKKNELIMLSGWTWFTLNRLKLKETLWASIQCEPVITKTNNKHGTNGLPSTHQRAFEILSGRVIGTNKSPFNQLCNQVIAIKPFSVGHYHCVIGAFLSYIHWDASSVVLWANKHVCGSAPSLSSRFYGSVGNEARHAERKLYFLVANGFKHNMIHELTSTT